MTDRLNALIVVLERDTREDDAQPLIQAIEQLRGVGSVRGNVANVTDAIAEDRAKSAIRRALWDAFAKA